MNEEKPWFVFEPMKKENLIKFKIEDASRKNIILSIDISIGEALAISNCIKNAVNNLEDIDKRRCK